jgi:hypothetical protein
MPRRPVRSVDFDAVWLRVLTGAHAGRAFEITGEPVIIGRDRRCGIVLREPGVELRHARFDRHESGAHVLEDLGSKRGTFVDSRRIRRPALLRGDEELCFGDTFAVLSPTRPVRRHDRRRLGLAAAVVAALAAAGITAGVLAPRAGGPSAATLQAAAPAAAGSVTVAAPSSETVGDAAAATVEVPPTPTGTPQPTGETPADDSPTVYREDFSDPGSGFESFDDGPVTAGYEDGEYVIRIDDSSWYATADSGRAFPSPTVRLSVENPGRSANAGFGVVCHYLGQRTFDVLAVGTDGTYAILRQRGASLEVITGGGTWQPSPLVPVGAERYRIRADCGDRRLRLFVNGRRVAAARSDSLAGTVGLFVAGRAELRFDDLLIRSRPAG